MISNRGRRGRLLCASTTAGGCWLMEVGLGQPAQADFAARAPGFATMRSYIRSEPIGYWAAPRTRGRATDPNGWIALSASQMMACP
jgi:hypothetical protein